MEKKKKKTELKDQSIHELEAAEAWLSRPLTLVI